MYSLLRHFLFKLDAETSHNFSLKSLALAQKTHLLPLFMKKIPSKPLTIWGMEFFNPVGLAAGLDKNGDYFNALGQMGFGFIEIGTVTPKPQDGNDKPRLFRLPEYEAIINRMGFNNKGVDYLCGRVERRRFPGVLGINIGKNKVTPEEEALNDYLFCMEKVYTLADYITINISSPNTPGLRDLQHGDNLKKLLSGIKEKQEKLRQQYQKYTPIALKIAPDMDFEQLQNIAQLLLEYEIDGVIATNTTIDKSLISNHPLAAETGGLSGRPLVNASTEVIRQLRSLLGPESVIIGVGGISSAQDAKDKLEAGANLLQIYSAFIYQGPSLIHNIVSELNAL